MYLSIENLGEVARALNTEVIQVPRKSVVFPKGVKFIDGKDPTTGNFVFLTIQTETPFSQICNIAIYPLRGLPERLEIKNGTLEILPDRISIVDPKNSENCFTVGPSLPAAIHLACAA